jgi:hypothetical protein
LTFNLPPVNSMSSSASLISATDRGKVALTLASSALIVRIRRAL